MQRLKYRSYWGALELELIERVLTELYSDTFRASGWFRVAEQGLRRPQPWHVQVSWVVQCIDLYRRFVPPPAEYPLDATASQLLPLITEMDDPVLVQTGELPGPYAP